MQKRSAIIFGSLLAAFCLTANVSRAAPQAQPSAADAGPIRLVRISFLHGSVSWRAQDTDHWQPAALNLPLRQGAQLWISGQGRAELQFDDGSELRLGPHALVTLQTLYSDTHGEFTELTLPQGLASLHLQNPASFYQVDTPAASLQSVGPAQLRLNVTQGTNIAVQQGQAQAEDDQFRRTLGTGDAVDVTDAQAPMTLEPLPPADAWDRFNTQRDLAMTASANDLHFLPPQLALVSGNLSRDGQWRKTDDYGEVWVPSEPVGWVPYRDGDWVWINPFGWTWVSHEPWGWVTYHYGTWINTLYGWAWVPGAGDQYWSPAVVSFAEKDGEIAWAPLAPWEVNRTVVLNHCYTGGPDWSVYFSIGGAAVYEPEDASVCGPVPWQNRSVNHPQVGPAPSRFYTVVAPETHRFVPNSTGNSGASQVPTDRFGLPGRRPVLVPAAQATTIFRQGRSVTGRAASGGPVSGPVDVRPASPGTWQVQVVAAPPPDILSRAVLRPSLPPHVGSVSSASGVFVTPAGQSSDRTAQSVPSGHRRGGGISTTTQPSVTPMGVPSIGRMPQSSPEAAGRSSQGSNRVSGRGWAGRGGIARPEPQASSDTSDLNNDSSPSDNSSPSSNSSGGGGGGSSNNSGVTSGHRR